MDKEKEICVKKRKNVAQKTQKVTQNRKKVARKRNKFCQSTRRTVHISTKGSRKYARYRVGSLERRRKFTGNNTPDPFVEK